MSRNPRRMGMEPPRHHQQRPALSPWEGGFAPGSNASGGGGLLPTPPVPSLLSQFSSPEAQLAVASNLLTSLLRPVQNSMQSSGQVPSLMSLGTSGSSMGSYGGMQQQQQSSYRDNYSRGSQYNDSMSSHSQRRSFDNHHNRSPVRNAASKRPQHSARGRQGRGSSPTHKPRSASSDHQRDSKRDVAVKKDKDATFKEPAGKRGAAYEGLPKAAFHCHLCKKNMWDAVSFDNHVKGMAHQRMIEEREKSYQVKADLLRHDAKLEEQQKQIEMERLVRLGKKPAPSRREYCKMCDFAFFGDLGAHRKSKIHQTLKNFLHPKCNACQKEFALRIEQDRHLLSADHLKKVFKIKSPEDDSKTDTEESDKLKKETEEEKEAEKDIVELNDGEDVEMIDEMKAESGEAEEEPEAEKSAQVIEEECPITPFPTSYDPDVSVGQNFVIPAAGMFCKACRRFFLHEDQALTSHCRTLGHFNNCLALSNQEQKVNGDESVAAAKSEPAATSGKRPQLDDSVEELQDAKRPKSEELYDPMGESPPTPELDKFESNNEEGMEDEVKEETNIDKDLSDLIDEFEDKSVPTSNYRAQGGRARRGRSFRGRGRGRM